MSSVELLDTFGVLLAFISNSKNEPEGSQHLRAVTVRMFSQQD